MRVRNLALAGAVVGLIGSTIWLFSTGTAHNSLGAGGLPLIKADTSPVKLPPDEPGGEIMPNAESTVFSAMGDSDGQDPSMENLKPPSLSPAASFDSGFAGLRTGFAIPQEPEKKTESLFGTAAPEIEPVQPKTSREYVSGLAPIEQMPDAEAEAEPEIVQEQAPEQIIQEVMEEQKAAPSQEPAPEPVIVYAPIETGNEAQALEAREKSIIRPVSKPANMDTSKATVTATSKPDVAKTATPKPEKPAQKDPVRDVIAQVINEENPKPATSTTYAIQIASVPAGAAAAQTWARMVGKFPGALAGLTPHYETVTLPGKGDYSRIQAGSLTRDQAEARCKSIRQSDPKAGCLVIRK